jgi:hypothetical protein
MVTVTVDVNEDAGNIFSTYPPPPPPEFATPELAGFTTAPTAVDVPDPPPPMPPVVPGAH